MDGGPQVHIRQQTGNGKYQPFNNAFAGLSDRFKARPQPEPAPQPKPAQPIPSPALTPEPRPAPQLPLPPPQKRSRQDTDLIKALTSSIGRSAPYVRGLLRVLRSNDGVVIGALLERRITVHRALALIDRDVAKDRALSRRFNAAPRHIREQLIDLL
jgi:hypothetical protein